MSDDFKNRVAHQAQREFHARRAALHADLAAHEQNQDEISGSETLRQLAQLDVEEQAAANLYRRHLESQQPRGERYVSDDARAAREPGELDAKDLGKICGISREEYLRQYARLADYKRMRGEERK
jgi:hypothetical protein